MTAIATAITLAVGPMAALAEEPKGLPILRDTETEQLLRDYARPILRVAGLEKQNIQVTVINQAVFNAFVADGRRIFVNHGALMQSETPNQIIGVLAHETGHLAGGHLARLREEVSRAQTQMIIAMILGVGALAAGARSASSGNTGLADAGAAAIGGPQSMILRSLLSYQRQQEESADRAGVKFLTATGQSAKGMYETFKRFTNDSLFSAHGADPYYQSHPMPAERVAALEEMARTSPYWDKKDDPALQLRHDMMRAKISVLEMVLGFFGVHFGAVSGFNGNGAIGIGFSVFVVIIAALNLVLDFDFIEAGARAGAPKYMEWYGAFGLMVTLIWLYFEILRLFSKLRSRN